MGGHVFLPGHSSLPCIHVCVCDMTDVFRVCMKGLCHREGRLKTQHAPTHTHTHMHIRTHTSPNRTLSVPVSRISKVQQREHSHSQTPGQRNGGHERMGKGLRVAPPLCGVHVLDQLG